jgi:two-component system chemotaxis response regulator CheB
MTAAVPAAMRDPIRVMVVDDSLVVRSLVTGWLADCPDLTLVAALRTGREAVDAFERADPDVVILDVEMPELDGLAALPLLLAKKRNLTVIMASTLTRRNAEVSLKALALGAADYVSKPESRSGVSLAAFRQGLIEKTRQIGGSRRLRQILADVPPRPARPAPHIAEPFPAAIFESPPADPPVALRRANVAPARALLIGASTGGPQALMRLLPQLRAVAERLPILIVQHMPPTFTTILAEHLSRACGWSIREAEDGAPVVAGQMCLARGDRHMRVARRNGRPVIELDDGAPINFCKPSVDPLFASASEVWGGGALGIVLTGMGHDGTAGARAIVNAGGTVIAQDEATSVVWGMPGAVAHAGLCSAVLPLDAIAPKIVCQYAGEFA